MAETHHRDGLNIGGMAVDKAFETLLSNIFGNAVIDKFQKKFRHNKCFIFFGPLFCVAITFTIKYAKQHNLKKNAFWRAKHSLPAGKKWNVRLDWDFKNYLQSTFGSLDTVEEKLRAYSKIDGKSKLEGEFLELSYEAWLSLHQQVLDAMCEFVSKLLDLEQVKPNVLIVTGGFSNCPYVIPRLQKLISERKDLLKIYQPLNPHESVVRGSVLWAINKRKLLSLRAPLTLGWSIDRIWCDKDPDDDHKVSSFESYTGYIRKKCLKIHLIGINEVYLLPRQQKFVEFELHKSKYKDEMYCDDKTKCQLLKKFKVFFENPFSEQVNLKIKITLGSDRVRLSYKHPETKSLHYARVIYEDENVDEVVKIGVEFEEIERKESM
ncbi:hypothetical protein RFI_01026 [Reticulomyxa filosa]|uniref:Uncharacterized protein n=1 Tax=Reticulomyxa filosa TaxID=46433 RepID=X6PCU2_RETFI|nr:hypothetical protein RFI_01026 [Reticulomyxa filosa]|eukprot:ETO36036.1 hypothetical protein RFI_01026 [Reticulomyxa filosa]